MKNLFVLFLLLAAGISTYAQTETDQLKVYTFVEEMPKFPGGDNEMIKFLQAHIIYPAKDKEEGNQGKVIVRFIIHDDGGISDVTVTRGVSEGLDAEAVRVVRMLPDFKPGKQQGKPVAVYYTLPIAFKL